MSMLIENKKEVGIDEYRKHAQRHPLHHQQQLLLAHSGTLPARRYHPVSAQFWFMLCSSVATRGKSLRNYVKVHLYIIIIIKWRK